MIQVLDKVWQKVKLSLTAALWERSRITAPCYFGCFVFVLHGPFCHSAIKLDHNFIVCRIYLFKLLFYLYFFYSLGLALCIHWALHFYFARRGLLQALHWRQGRPVDVQGWLVAGRHQPDLSLAVCCLQIRRVCHQTSTSTDRWVPGMSKVNVLYGKMDVHCKWWISDIIVAV